MTSLNELGIESDELMAILKFVAKVIVGIVVRALNTLIFTAGLAVKTIQILIDKLNWLKNLKTITIDIIEKITRKSDKDKRAVGGLVTPGKAFLVGERGPELFVPPTTGKIVTAEKTAGVVGGGGNVVNFNVHIGMFAGSEVEKRNIAETLYKSLVNLANTQNTTVAALLGG